MAAWDKSDPVTVTSAVSKFLQFISSDTLSFTPNPPPHPANPKVCTDRQRPINCGLDTFLHSTFSKCYVFIILPKKFFNLSLVYTRVCRRKRKQCDTIPCRAAQAFLQPYFRPCKCSFRCGKCFISQRCPVLDCLFCKITLKAKDKNLR